MTDTTVIATPAYGGMGPNFIVWDKGYISREEIKLKQAEGGIYPEGLVLKINDGGDEVLYEPFDGSGQAAGILFQGRNVSKGDTSATAVVRIAEVQRAMLKFAGTLSDTQKEAAYASLAALHIAMR